MKIPAYLIDIEQAFEANANTAKAGAMQKYMKGQYAYFGISAPRRQEITRDHLKRLGQPDPTSMAAIVKWCWTQPEREYQYLAMELLYKQAKKTEPEIIDLYVYTLTHKSWWDTVDYLAANLIGTYMQQFPSAIELFAGDWMKSGNMWLQRTCLLFQLRYKQKTDIILLDSFIQELISSKEFFIRKAMGWALREYSKTNSDFVIDYVNANKHSLSGLSKREALKWLERKANKTGY